MSFCLMCCVTQQQSNLLGIIDRERPFPLPIKECPIYSRCVSITPPTTKNLNISIKAGNWKSLELEKWLSFIATQILFFLYCFVNVMIGPNESITQDDWRIILQTWAKFRPHASCSFVVCLACPTALFKSVQLPASAEMLHLHCSLKYACRHYQLQAPRPLQLGEIEDITALSAFRQSAPVSQHWFEPVSVICYSLDEISDPP